MIRIVIDTIAAFRWARLILLAFIFINTGFRNVIISKTAITLVVIVRAENASAKTWT